MKRAGSTVVALFLVAWGANPAMGQDWTRFRGPDGAGHGVARGLPVEFTAEDYNWRVELPGPGHSSPVIWKSGVYLTCIDDSSQLALIRLDTGDGHLVWKRSFPIAGYGQHVDNSFAASTPTVDAAGVYLTFVSGSERFAVACSHDGEERWKESIGRFQSKHGAGASAIVVDGLVVVPNESEHEESAIVALDAATGEACWKLDRDGGPKGSFITPALYRNRRGGVELITAGQAHGITSVDPKRGTILWELATGFLNRSVGSPIVAKGLIVLTAGSGGGGKEFVAIRPGSSDPVEPAAVAYTNLRQALPYVPTAIAVGDLLFLWADSGIVTCLEAATGEMLWKERISSNCYSSPICIEDRLYNISREGQLHVLAAALEFAELARIDLGEPTQASPAVADGTLYLRTVRHLISVGGD